MPASEYSQQQYPEIFDYQRWRCGMIGAYQAHTSRNEQAFENFDIRNFINRLEPAKEKGKYKCPACDGHNFTWDKSEPPIITCWNGCERKEIKKILNPWDQLQGEHHGNNYTPRQRRTVNKPQTRKPKPAPISAGELITIAMLAEPATDIPQPQQTTNRLPEGLPGSTRETIYTYSDVQWVVRYQWPDDKNPKGYDKTFRQGHRLPDGTRKMKKGDKPWPGYRREEAIVAAKSVKGISALLQHEGEGCVEVGRSHGIAGFTFQGSSWGKETITTEYQIFKDAGVGLIIFLHDADEAGLKKLQTCEDYAAEVGIGFIGISPFHICPDLPYKSSDIKEILGQMETPEFIRKLEEQIHAAVEERSRESAEEEREEGELKTFHSTTYNNLLNSRTPYDLTDTEAFYKSVCQGLSLPYENCVTAGTFDGWVYRKVFPKTEWMVTNSSFYKWSEENKVWQRQHEGKVNKRVAEAAEDAYKLSSSEKFGWKITKPYETNNFKKSALEFCRSRLELAEALPTNTHLLGFRNCVVDLRTGEQMPHSKDFYLTNVISHEYEANKPCPEVYRQFLIDSFGLELVEVIRAFTSMFLDPTAPYGRFPHLLGLSGGGKGTQGRLWSSFFGEEGSSSAAEFEDISGADARHQYLTGKRIFGFPDVGGYVKGLRAFYELVDNGPMSGRPLFSSVAYLKQWYVRFWIASVNHLQIENAGDGWMRRAYPIPVKNRNVTPDPDLWRKLQEVKSDIISWALAMPREERDRILLSPPSSDRAKNMVLDASLYGDSTKSFVDLCLRPSTTATFVSQNQLHSWYVLYCKEHGYAPLGMSKFISHLKTVLPHNFKERSWTPMVNGKRERIQSHFTFLWHLEKAFDVSVPDGKPDPSKPKTEFWTHFKAECFEGGIEEFEQFWNPTKTPEPSHSKPVHPVQGQNIPLSNPGQPETLTQPTCPSCPSVQPKELTLHKDDEKNISESGVDNNVYLTYNPKVPLDNLDKMDSPAVTGLQPVQASWTPENEVDSLDSLSVTGLQPVQDASQGENISSPLLMGKIIQALSGDPEELRKLLVEADEEEREAALRLCTPKQATHLNNVAIDVDERNQDRLYPPGILIDPQKVDDNVGYIREVIECPGSDWEMITQLTDKWKPGFKKEVWEKLSPKDREAAKQLKTGDKTHEENTGNDTPPTDNLVDPASEPNSEQAVDAYEWKRHERAIYCGQEVSLERVSRGDNFVTVRYQNDQREEVSKFLLEIWRE